MAYHKATEDIQTAWDELSNKWNAEVKSKYFTQLYSTLMSETDDMYIRNEKLEDYAESCIRSLDV